MHPASPVDLHAAAPAWLLLLRRLLRSPGMMLAETALAALAFVLSGEAQKGLSFVLGIGVFFVLLITATLLLSDDVFATTCPFLLLTVVVSFCHGGQPFEVFIRFLPLALPVIAALIFHFVYYRGHYRIGYSFRGLLAVAVAVTLGGIGCLSPAAYFTPAALYYVVGLGFGMVGLYCILKAQAGRTRDYDLRGLLLLSLYCAALAAAFFTFDFYLDRLIWMKDDLAIYGHLRLISIDNRNIFATYILMGLPAPFYFAAKGRGAHLLPAFLFLGALLLTGSRGGLLMGVLLFALCFLYLLRRDVRHRRRNIILLAVLASGALAAGGWLLKFYFFRFEGGFIQGDEPRVLLLKRALTDFLSHPIFGVGLAYTGNADIYDPKHFAMNWYHMMIPQVVAGLGLVGTAAYGYQLFGRARLFFKNRDALSRALGLSYIGLLLMSQVNPGEFCPMPYTFMGMLIFLFLEENTPPPVSDPNEKGLCAVLSAAMLEETPTLPAGADPEKILRLARAHMVFGVAGEGFGYLPEDALPEDLLIELQNATVLLLRQNEGLAVERRALCAHLRERGIPAVILKGDSVARHYPTPDLRVAGDIDCLVRPADLPAVAEFLAARGYRRVPDPDGEDHQVIYAKDAVKIELHHAVMGLPAGAVGEALRDFLADLTDRAVTVGEGSDTFPVPAPDHQAVILLLHMQQHMREGGLGLRQVMDFCLFAEKEWTREWDAVILPAFERFGLARFAEAVLLACHRHLGLPVSAYPFPLPAAPAAVVLADGLFADFMAGGNFGQADAAYAGSAVVTLHREKGGNAFTVALSNVAEKCREAWPICRKCPPLLLFFLPFWVIRRMLCSKKGGVNPAAMLHSAGKRGRLYDALALFETTEKHKDPP